MNCHEIDQVTNLAPAMALLICQINRMENVAEYLVLNDGKEPVVTITTHPDGYLLRLFRQ